MQSNHIHRTKSINVGLIICSGLIISRQERQNQNNSYKIQSMNDMIYHLSMLSNVSDWGYGLKILTVIYRSFCYFEDVVMASLTAVEPTVGFDIRSIVVYDQYVVPEKARTFFQERIKFKIHTWMCRTCHRQRHIACR